MRRVAAVALLAAGCKLLLGDPDRIIALDIVGPLTYAIQVDDTLQLLARARAATSLGGSPMTTVRHSCEASATT